MLITLLSIGLAISTKSVVMLVLGKDPAGYPGFSGDAVLNILRRQGSGADAVDHRDHACLYRGRACVLRTDDTGKIVRAVAADRDAASLVGINVQHSVMWSFVIGALAGGIAGAIITPQTFTSYDQGGLIGFKGFSAAMLGGIGNLYGALLGGLVLGLLETFAAGYVSSHFKDAVAFIVLLIILFALPSGLLGRSEAERV